MSREQSLMRMLEASAVLQKNIALLLEAKALEAEKVRNWLCNHMVAGAFDRQEEQLKEAVQVHGQLIEVIEGLTRVGQGMTGVLKAVLQQEDEAANGLNGSFSFGESDG